MRERDSKYKQFLETIKENVNIDFHRNNYKFIRNKVVSELKKAKKNYYQNLNFIGLKTGKNRQHFRTQNDQKQDLKIGPNSYVLDILKHKILDFQ